ncbi:hypothetical protein, partial [Eubacterium sp. 1001713B170207_170306_E7]|uniref:hypothetical protein n=1 Tax=Eubacterium sp. 1001713B170207_170306_E7 TaxID=2787097 RepID=UPI001A9B2AFC
SEGKKLAEITVTEGQPAQAAIDKNNVNYPNAGTATLTAVYSGSSSLNGTQESTTLTVGKANGTASVTLDGWAYGQTPADPVAESATNIGVEPVFEYKVKDAADTTYTSDKPTLPGAYTVRAIFGETANYKAVTATAEFTIAMGSYTDLTFENKTVTYNGQPQRLTVAGTLPQGTTVTYAPESATDAGSYLVTATISGQGYVDRTLTATLSIEAATPVVTITPAAGQDILVGQPVTLDVAVAGIRSETVTGNVSLNGETKALKNGQAAFTYTPADDQ